MCNWCLRCSPSGQFGLLRQRQCAVQQRLPANSIRVERSELYADVVDAQQSPLLSHVVERGQTVTSSSLYVEDVVVDHHHPPTHPHRFCVIDVHFIRFFPLFIRCRWCITVSLYNYTQLHFNPRVQTLLYLLSLFNKQFFILN